MAKRILYFDLLTIFACFAVVCLHCNTLVHSFQPGAAWDQALAIEVVMYWAVPIFFMLTGANNMEYRAKYDTKTFLKRRMKKLLIPFVAWSGIIYLIRCIAGGSSLSILGFLTDFMNCSIEPIYWFFFAIISITLAMPILSLLAQSTKALWYLVITSFLLTFFIPYFCQALDLPWSGAFNLPVAGGFVTYAILGYLLATQSISRKSRLTCYALGILFLALRYAYTYQASYEAGFTVRVLFDYNTVFAFFPSVAVFLAFKQIPSYIFLERHAAAIASIAGCGFGIYLIHKILLDYLIFGLGEVSPASMFVRLVCPFIIYASALMLVLIIKKIPLIRNLVP